MEIQNGRETMKKKNKLILPVGISIIVILTASALSLISTSNVTGTVEDFIVPEQPTTDDVVRDFYHGHIDFKVFINNNEFDFSRPQYDHIDPRAHIHATNDFGGYVIHHHHREASMGIFFSSLNITFNSTCFGEYCNNENSVLKLYVNGKENQEFGDYIPEDLDRILITYGPRDADTLEKQIEAVTDVACAFSQLCPIPRELVGQNLL
jgi:hypothetical protein